MKTLKIFVLAVLVFAGQKLMAQNVHLTENTGLITNGTIDFNFSSCPTVSFGFWAGSVLSTPSGCGPAFLTSVDIPVFDDVTCSPVTTGGPVTLTPLLPTATYTTCSGVVITFSLFRNVLGEWEVSIN